MTDAPSPVALADLLAHRKWVRALALRLASDANTADDLEQETWLVALRSPPREAGSLRGWLGTVLRNLARTRARRTGTRRAYEAKAPLRGPAPAADDVVAEAEVQAKLVRIVLELDEPYRSTVLMRYFRGVAASEIAARAGVPVETVRTRLKRAVKQLRERLDADFDNDRRAWCVPLLGCLPERIGSATTGSVAAGIGGGIVMAGATKAIVGSAVVLAAGLAWWMMPDGPEPAAAPDTAVTQIEDADGARPTRKRPSAAPARAPDVPAATIVPPTPPTHPDGFVVRGRVVDAVTGDPVAGVSVTFVHEHGRMPGEEPIAGTAADGTFEYAGGTDGAFNAILLVADGYAENYKSLPWWELGSKREKGEAGDLLIHRGITLTGRVVRSDGSTPVPDARLYLSRLHGMSGPMWIGLAEEWGKAGPDGRFSIERLPPSHAAPYTMFAVSPLGIAWTKLPATAGREDVPEQTLTLGPTGSAAVTVNDESGAPRANVIVFASPRFEPLGPGAEWGPLHDVWLHDWNAARPLFSAQTDARGVARFPVLPLDTGASRFDFVARGEGGARAWKDGATVGPREETAVEIVLGEAHTWAIAGIVRDENGAPFAGAEVTPGWGSEPIVTASDGRFSIEGIRPDWERFSFDVAAVGYAEVSRTEIPSDDGSPVQVEVRLEKAMPVAGRVVDQDGEPLGDIQVSLRRGHVFAGSAKTDADGKFRVEGAAAGAWDVWLMPPPPFDLWENFGNTPAVQGGDEDAVLVLRRFPPGKATVVAHVVDAATGEGLAPAEAMVLSTERAASGPRVPYRKLNLGSDRLTIELMHAGEWRLWVRVPGRPATVVKLDVDPAQTEVDLRVEVGHAGTIRGRIDRADDAQPKLRYVSLELADQWTAPGWAQHRGGTLINMAEVAEDGTFVFEDVMPARYHLRSTVKGYEGETTVTVSSGDEVQTTLAMQLAAVLSFESEAPAPSDIVVYELAEGDGPWKLAMRRGGSKDKVARFEKTVAPGRWRWRVTFPADNVANSTREAARTAEGVVTVGAGDNTHVDVPVRR